MAADNGDDGCSRFGTQGVALYSSSNQALSNAAWRDRHRAAKNFLRILKVTKKMEEPPLKKQRVEGLNDKKDDWDPVVPAVDDEFGAKYTQEETVGITEFINQNFEGFDCILKYKYFPTDTELTEDTLILW